MIPGEILSLAEPVELHAGQSVRLTVTNKDSIPIHLTSHFHLMEANKRLCFDRLRAFGMRLHTHAKGAVRIEAGETTQIEIVPIGGTRRVFGFNGAVDGSLDETDPEMVLQRLIERGFRHQDEAAP